MVGTQSRGSRVRGSRRCGLLRRSASASVGHTRTQTNAGLVAVVAVGSLILAGCGGTTGSGTSPTASPAISRGAVASPCATGGGAANTCVVGDTGPGGGIVFYVNSVNTPGSNYMEAVVASMTPAWSDTNAGSYYIWCVGGGQTANVTTGAAIGAGKVNTDNMVTACTSGAANSVRAYTGGGLAVGSWSLPSRDELNALYVQRATVGGFAAVFYWSSSQLNSGSGNAWFQSFGGGSQGDGGKGNAFRVRPVRAF